LPEHMGIAEDERAAREYLARTETPEGRLKVVVHNDTSLKLVKLSDATAPQGAGMPPGLGEDNAAKRRAIIMVSEALGETPAQNLGFAAQDDAGFTAFIDGKLRSLAQTASFADFSSAVSASVGRQVGEAKGDARILGNIGRAEKWLMARAARNF